MPDVSQSNWSPTDSSNNQATPNGWASGVMLASGVEPSARMMMGAIRRWWERINGTLTSTGSANVHVLTYTVAPPAYVTGEVYRFIAGFTNAGATTLNVNALGAKAIQYQGAALVGNEIVAGRVATVVYDGTQFQLATSQVDTTNASNLSSGTLATARLPTVPIANGGTGQTTALAAFNAIVAIGASVANPGYIKLENGLIFQWGHAAYTGVNSVTSNFALAFPSTVFSAMGISDDTGAKPITTLSALTLTQITFAFDKSSTGNIYYWAVGN